MEKFLTEKVALITGAFQNLGAVIASTFAEYGADVILNDLGYPENLKIGRSLVETIRSKGTKAEMIAADVSQASEVSRLCKEALHLWGHVDILVNGAGPFSLTPFTRLEEKEWDRVLDVNLKAVYLTTKELFPSMKKQGWGRIINICAGSAFVKNHGVYGLAKAGVQFLTESLALEVGPEVTVNAVAPGQIYESLPVVETYDPTFGERYTERAPMKRLVTRKEVAKAIVQLCSDTYDIMTGVTMRLDGGAEIHRF